MKKLILLGILPIIAGCSNIGVNTPLSASSDIKSNISDKIVLKVSENKGADFETVINIKAFNTKANTNGTPAKTGDDIAKVDVYLLTLTSPNTSTDPLGASNVNVVRSFTDVAKTGSSFNLLFKNVPGIAGKEYWVGVVAKDSSGNVISKAPSTAWTGQTALTAPAMALTSSGVGVDATSLAVSSTSNLTVNLPLLDAVGAQINTDANVSNGISTLPTVTIQ